MRDKGLVPKALGVGLVRVRPSLNLNKGDGPKASNGQNPLTDSDPFKIKEMPQLDPIFSEMENSDKVPSIHLNPMFKGLIELEVNSNPNLLDQKRHTAVTFKENLESNPKLNLEKAGSMV